MSYLATRMQTFPNYFSLAYSLGRTHTSMLAYVCECHNAGQTAPLRALLEALGLSKLTLPAHINHKFEWRGADLGQ